MRTSRENDNNIKLLRGHTRRIISIVVLMGGTALSWTAMPFASGIQTVLAGTGTWKDITHGDPLPSPSGIAVDGNGDVFEANVGNETIQKLPSGTSTWKNITNSATFNTPEGIAVDSGGDVFVTNANSTSTAVEELPNGTSIWKNITDNGSFNSASGIAVDSKGDLFVTNANNSTSDAVEELPSGTSKWQDITGNGSFNSPSGIAVDGNGDLFVVNYGNTGSNVVEELPSGTSKWQDITHGGTFNSPQGIAVGSNGNVYVTNSGNNTSNAVEELPSGTSKWQDISNGGSFNQPYGIAVDSSNDVFVTNFENVTSNAVEELTLPSAPSAPTGLTFSNVTQSGWTESWSSVSSATGYNVYVNGTKINKSPVTGTSFKVTNESANTSYKVTVTALNANGESSQSSVDTVNTLASTLTILSNPTVTSTSGSVDVSGDATANESVTLSAQAGSWDVNGKSTRSTVYSVYANSQGAYNVSWIAPTVPGLYTLSATSNGTMVNQDIAVTTFTQPGSPRTFKTSPTGNVTEKFQGLVSPNGQTSNVQIDVPQGALGTGTSVFVSSTSNTSNITPSGTNVVADVAVNFQGTPQQPMTLTVQNPNIQSGDVVYKVLPNGTYKQILGSDAMVNNGQAVITFQSDPAFVVTKSLNVGGGGGPVPPTIIQDSFTEPAQVGQKYSTTIHETGGTNPMKWAVTSGNIPPGLTLDNQGDITGTATKPGTYTFTVKVTDANSLSSTKQLSLTVNGTASAGGGSSMDGGTGTSTLPSIPISVATSKIQNANVGSTVHIHLQANGGQLPYTWSVVGALPKGLRLDQTTGVLSGTPQSAGVHHVTVKVTGAKDTTSEQNVTIDVLRKYEREVLWNGTVKNVPAIVQKEGSTETTYMPIWYVMQLLKPMGIQSTWNGKHWLMTTSSKPDLSNINAGSGNASIFLNGTLVQQVNTVAQDDPSTKKPTTYMPIWYVMQLLKRVGLQSSWNGTTWTVTK